LGEYVELGEKYRGAVWIDDAHGTGILGKAGKGTCEHQGVSSPVLYTGTTLSKAFGAYGGAIAGSSALTGRIRKGNVMSGSNSPMNAAVAASLKGIELVESHPRWREDLWENARYLRLRLKESDSYLPVADVEDSIPVIACTTGDSRNMQSIQQRMLKKGIYLQYTTYPGSGKEGLLRMVVSSAHTFQQIDRLAEELKDSVR
jgi:7-keto-8-aminopelargonate synthetase-like enzyme